MIQRENIEAVCRLSGVQSGLLFHHVHSPKAGFYFTQHVVSLLGDLIPDLLAESWQGAVDRHQALRASFHWQDAEVPLQIIERRVQLPFQQLDWTAEESGEQERRLKSYLETDAARGFEIAHAPLMRLALIRFSVQEWRLCWSNHHLILDGWSAAIVAHDAFRIYEALLDGCQPNLPPALQYQDYVRWLYQQDERDAEKFWGRILCGYDPQPLFASSPTFVPEVHRKRLGRELSEELRGFSKRSKITLSNVMQAAWTVLLSRYTGRMDIAFGAVTSGRSANLQGMQAAAGLFINTLPIRVQLTPATRVRDLLDTVQKYNLEIQSFEYLPLAKIQHASGIGGGRPLFDSLIVYENYPVADEVAQGNGRLRVENVQVKEGTHFPLTILVGPGPELALTLQYDYSRFGESIRALADDFQTVLAFFCADSERQLREFAAGEAIRALIYAAQPVRTEGPGDYVEPRNATELLLAKLWGSVLHCERVGVFDNFFSLGGDSIRSIQLKAMARRNGMDFELQDLFDCPTIASLSLRLRFFGADTAGAPTAGPFALISPTDRLRLPAGIEDAYPLAAMQSGMLYHASYDRESSSYLYTFSFEMEGRVSPEAFALAVRELLTRHPVLRTSFEIAAYSVPLQLVHKVVELPLEIHDLCTLSPQKQDELVSGWFESSPVLPVAKPPLLRFHIHVRSAERFHLGLWMHHGILDGWSLTAMMRELLQIYQSHFDPCVEIQDAPPNLFREFVRLERECVNSEAARAFWSSKLQALSGASKAMIHAVPNVPKHARLEAVLDFGHDLSARLASIASRSGVTLKAILLTAHCRVLALLSGTDHAVTGYVVDGRPEDSGADECLGLFLNTVPVALSLDSGWIDAIHAAHAAEAELLPHRRFPLLEIQRINGGAPVFQSAFNFTNFHLYRDAIANGDFKAREQRLRAELTFDLFADFNTSVSDQTIRLTLQGDTGVFSRERLHDLLECYRVALEAIATDPFARIDAAPGFPPALRQELLEINSAAPLNYPRHRCVHHFIEDQAKRTPDRVAVQCGVDTLTYSDLDQRAEVIAAHLIRHGVCAETLVAVALPRTADLVPALLAIWKAGGAYVPIDLAYPPHRISLLLRAARPCLTLTTRTASIPSDVPVSSTLYLEDLTAEIPTDGLNAAPPSPQCLAYLIFTSGSTGSPKGVAIQHDNATAFLHWAVHHFPSDCLAAVLASTSVCFDLSVFEMFAPLLCGGRTVIVENALQLIDRNLEGIVLLNTVPSVMRELLNAGAIPKSVRTVNLAGEALSAQLANDVLSLTPVQDLFNLYGPSEDTTYSTCCRIADKQTGAPSIGRSIAGTQLYLLDAREEPVLRGSIGEIYLGGEGVARGYLRQPGLTASRFVPDPFAKRPGARLYRTGDLARYDNEGKLEFLGRKDDQVKVRGFRVEPAEIEAHLCAHPNIAEAAVVLQEAVRGKQLVAFYCSPQKSIDSADLRRYLSKQVPDYMIPAEFQPVERLPRTANGKVDRKQLQSTRLHHQASKTVGDAPRGATERLLAEIWSEVLGIAGPRADDDFFESGGDSLLSVRLCAKAQAAGVSIVPSDVQTYRTIRGLALNAGSALRPSQRTDVQRGVPLMPAQSFFLNNAAGDPNHFNLSGLLLVDVRLDGKVWRDVIAALLTAQEALRLRFTSDGASWRAHIATPETAPPFDYVDLRDRPTEAGVIIANEAARRQTSLNLSSGPACRFVYFDTGAAHSSRLLFVVHHLTADGQSLLTLMDDLRAAIAQACSGKSIRLAQPFTPWSEWANWWNSRADSPDVLSELDHWLTHCKACQPIPVDFANKNDLLGEVQELDWTLSSSETAQLRAAAGSQNSDVSHMIIRALYRTLAEWTGSDAVRLDMIGHGRTFAGAPDVSRTAGYFAVRYPLRLESDRIDQVIKSARDGVGWGALRHLSRSPQVRHALAGYANPEVSFNYSSRQQAQSAGTNLVVPTDELVGVTQDPASRRACRLRLFARLLEDRMHIRWQFNPHIHRSSTIERLIAEFGVHIGSLMSSDRLVQTSSR